MRHGTDVRARNLKECFLSLFFLIIRLKQRVPNHLNYVDELPTVSYRSKSLSSLTTNTEVYPTELWVLLTAFSLHKLGSPLTNVLKGETKASFAGYILLTCPHTVHV